MLNALITVLHKLGLAQTRATSTWQVLRYGHCFAPSKKAKPRHLRTGVSIHLPICKGFTTQLEKLVGEGSLLAITKY